MILPSSSRSRLIGPGKDTGSVRWSRQLTALAKGLWISLGLAFGGLAEVQGADQLRLWAGPASAVSRGSISAADLCVIGGDLSRLSSVQKSTGQQWFLRLNPLDLSDADLIAKAEAAKVPMVAAVKGDRVVRRFDLADPGWIDFVVHQVLVPALGGVGDGWVLDGFDSSTEAAALQLLRRLSVTQANRRVFVSGEVALNLAEKSAGIVVEGADLLQRKSAIETATQRGQTVLAIAHGDPLQSEANAKLADSLREAGALAFVTPSDGSGVSLAPLVERSRRVLVLYGWDSRENEKPAMIPADTMTAELLQTPLEWLGYEADYAPVNQALPAKVAGRWAAVIVDGETQVPGALELKVVQWLAQVKAAGVPVLFAGVLPFGREDALAELRDVFGLKGTANQMDGPLRDLALVSAHPSMTGTEAKVEARSEGFRDLYAPDNSEVLVSLSARVPDGRQVKYSPVFLTSWGGMWLDPFVVTRASQDNSSFLADPYQLLQALLSKRGLMPAPDTTTRDGSRLFYSHIDGDGFASLSDFKGHPFCAEMVRDRILKAFPVPVTVSIVESDIRSWSEGVQDEWQPKLEEIARSIYALPNVQAASHSFSHPYCWDRTDPNPGIYTEPNLKLKPVASYPDIMLDREIRGSVDYINQTLLPPGGQVEIFLWSGNCRPGAEALRLLRSMNLENMNGGDTVISRLYPGIAGIAPRVTPWEDELQINAANQNEFMYANGWQGPFYGGFAKVIDTFERTETPRRLKPVNVYYHFYSAMNMSSLRALEKIHHWCMEQPLQPTTALGFARLTRDAWRTRVFDLGPRHWLIANEGQCRTLRLPGDAGLPDLARCKGIAGWTEHGGSLYVHTQGMPRIELVLRDRRPEPFAAAEAHLYLRTSSSEVQFSKHTAWGAEFAVKGLRDVTMVFGGLPARASGQVFVNQRPASITADERGHVHLSLPPTARVRLVFDSSRHVSLR